MKIVKLRKVLKAAAATHEKLGNTDVSQALSRLESLLMSKDKEEVGVVVDQIAKLRRKPQ